MKLIFVHLLSKSYFSDFKAHWHSRCALLYQNYDSAVFIPNNEDKDVRRELGIGARTRSWFPVPRCAQKVVTIDVWVPSRWENGTAFCNSRSWPQRYALMSGAFFVFHLLRSPLLQRYQIYAKIDSDVCMLKQLPIAPVLEAFGSRETLVFHTAIHRASDCERDVLTQLRQYRQARGLLANPMDAWCSASQLSEIFYGNFVFYNVSFMTSRAALTLTSYLYEERGDGFFKNRWTDQAIPPALICGTTSPVGAPMLSEDPRVRDGRALRAYFRHGRHARCGRSKKVARTRLVG